MATVDQVLEDRRERDRLRLRAAFVVALVVHLGVGVAVAVAPDFARQEPEPLEFVKVRVVPAAALGTSRPEPPRPKPPEPKPPEPEPEPEPPAPEPAPDPEPPPRPAVPPPEPPERRAPPPEPAPSRTAPSAPAASPERAQREGSPRGNPLGTSPFGVAGVDNPTFTYDYYLDQMLGRIESRWQRPRVSGPIEAMVHFRIDKEGRISEVEVVQPSGVPAFDLAAQRAVMEAAPFPPLPRSYRSDSLGVNLIVR